MEKSLSFHLDIILVILLLILPFSISGQQSSQTSEYTISDTVKQNSDLTDLNNHYESIEEFIQNNQEVPYEKIFLHIDRPDYITGDTIWFKAYSWYGYDQIPDTISGVLHVDLINSEGKVVQKRKLLIRNGTTHGEFCLDTTIIPGRYLLRAYTLLMHNLNSGEPFYQAVTINPANQNFHLESIPVIIKQTKNDSLKIVLRFFETDRAGNFINKNNHRISYSLKIGDRVLKDSIRAENTKEHILRYSLAGINKHDSIAEFKVSINETLLTFEKQIQIPLQDNIDLQFFPEGGTLVNSLESKVAFKAIGVDGLSREISGDIRTNEDSLVSVFKSSHKGMGVFKMKPNVGKEYFAHFWYNNQKYIVPLSPASEKGTALSVTFNHTDKDRLLTIKRVPSEETTSKYIIGTSYGKIWFSATVKLFIDSCSLKIPLELLPEGICRLTVLNNNFEPECERLIYINKNQRVKIEVIPDSASYSTRSRVSLSIKVTDLNGTPVQTDLSLAVVGKEQNSKDAGVHGIVAVKLLESELKGNIEDADSYFKSDSSEINDALDLLVLTQGYRKFLLQSTRPYGSIYKPEKHFEISGYLKLDGTKSQERKFNYRDIGLSLISVAKYPFVGLSNPDSMGNFKIQVPLLIGKQRLMLQATTSKKKRFNGDIFIEDPILPPQFIAIPTLSFNLPSPSVEYIARTINVKKTAMSEIYLPGTMSKTLGEVVVTAKANPKTWWRNNDKDAEKIADLDSLDPTGNKYENFNDLMVREFKAVPFNNASSDLHTVLLPSISFGAGRKFSYWFPIYMIDGNIYWNGRGFDFTLLKSLEAFPVDQIKRLLVIPPGKPIATNYAYEPIIGFPQYMQQSMVIIETYSKNTYRGDIPGVKKFILDGLDAPRAFYSPRYDGPDKRSPGNDDRITLYWEPIIQTNINGQAKVEFFTGDHKSGMEVVINGIDVANGDPGGASILLNHKIK
jgi:hypothetical protein